MHRIGTCSWSRTSLATAVMGAVALAGALSVGPAHGATANLEVSATVADNCSISTAPVAFGSYDPVVANASAELDGTGTVTVTCTSGASATVTLGQGENANTGSTDAAPVRRMVSGGNYLSYQLYSDSAGGTTWGNTTETGLAHTGTGLSTGLTVYGRIPGNQNVPTGSYSDTVVATVTF